MSRLPFCSFIIVAGLVVQISIQSIAVDRVAFVVGVDQYDHLPENAQLRVAVSDARLMAETLEKADPPFQVTLLEDETRLEIDKAFDSFIEQAMNAECALVYFAGHGIEYYGENFLLSRDTSISSVSAEVERMKRRLRNDSLSLQVVVDDLDATHAQVKVVIIDACRNNPLRVIDPTGTRSLLGANSGLAPVAAPFGTLISYSADAGQKANDGLFTEVLTKHLATPALTLMEVFANTRVEVRDRSTELANARRGVRHEPAEYVKVNPAALKFTFVKGAPLELKSSNSESEMAAMSAQIALLEKQLAEAKMTVAEQPAPEAESDEPTLSLVLAIEARLAQLESQKSHPNQLGLPSGAHQNAKVYSLDQGFPTSQPMVGAKAGELRSFGGIEMVWCPPGTFTMGSPVEEQARKSREVQHEVTLTSGFWIAKTECTQGLWKTTTGTNPSQFSGSDRLPVESVSWKDAQAWIEKMNQLLPPPSGWKWSLPTEAQWEYACRAGTTSTYAFGESLGGDQANIRTESNEGPNLRQPAVVASYQPNDWGIHDMHGNLWEWCVDWYADYPSVSATNPIGPADGEFRVYRGGSWSGTSEFSRSANRAYMIPHGQGDSMGFRAAVVFSH